MYYAEKLQKGLRLVACCAWAMMVLMFSSHAYAQQAQGLSKTVTVDVPAQKVSTALIELSKQAGVQVIMPGAELDKFYTQGIHGTMSLRDALDKLLQGTPLIFLETAPNTITVKPPTGVSGQLRDTTAELYSAHSQSQVGAGTAPNEPASPSQELDQVVVVGTRLRQSAKDSAVPVQVYTRQQIDASGTSSITDFLNTLPDVSAQSSSVINSNGATTVQIHGLPRGTTLVLVNGRRIEGTSGSVSSYGFFDLSSIPLAAIDRIEVLPTGSSAIYGGDALGGVVNIVLKQGFKGFEAGVRYGGTADGKFNEAQYNFAAGWSGHNWSLSLVGMYSGNSELSGNERTVTANDDYRAYGGPDNRYTYANPGNVCSADGKNLSGLSASCAAIPNGSTGVGLTPSSFSATAGVTNKTSTTAYESVLPPRQQYGLFAYGNYQIAPWAEVFTELLYSHQKLDTYASPPISDISVPSSNSNNPFNEDVTIQYLFAGMGRSDQTLYTDYFRPLLGVRGTIGPEWKWEVAGWTSRDVSSDSVPDYTTNTSTITSALAAGSFNPFKDGPGGTTSVLRSLFITEKQSYRGAIDAANGFIHGPLVTLASGQVEGLIGAEYQRDGLAEEDLLYPQQLNMSFHRTSEAVFGEIKTPIVGNHQHPEEGDILSNQIAARYDSFSDFDGHASFQDGLEFRPVDSLLVRASYASAFKPPLLYDLYSSTMSYQIPVNDPLRGGQSELVNLVAGGNPNLRAETGWSTNLGIVWSPRGIKGLDMSLTHWAIRIKNGVVHPAFDTLVYAPQDYPGRITRSPPAQGDAYQVGPITSINDTATNFGYINEAGFDLGVNYRLPTVIGEFSPSLSITQTYRYLFELDAISGPTNAVSQANDNYNFSPRWKGTAALNWKKGFLTLGTDGRYTGHLNDVTDLTPNPRGLGNFWYVDLSGRYEIGKALMPQLPYLSKTFVGFGVRNIFNKLPPYSDLDYGYVGYDANEYDIQGRYLWVQADMRF